VWHARWLLNSDLFYLIFSLGKRGVTGDLVPHVSRVSLGTLHVLGCVIFVYVLDVNYVLVYLCVWWLIAIGEPYTCANKVNDNLRMMKCYVYLILFIFSIMIDVKLTPSGLWWAAYLFVWMDRWYAGLVVLLAWWVLEDSGSYLCWLFVFMS